MKTHIYVLRFITFFFNDTATTEIYTLSLHDALPIYKGKDTRDYLAAPLFRSIKERILVIILLLHFLYRSEERFSRNAETDLVCRLLLEKKITIRRVKVTSSLPAQRWIFRKTCARYIV